MDTASAGTPDKPRWLPAVPFSPQFARLLRRSKRENEQALLIPFLTSGKLMMAQNSLRHSCAILFPRMAQTFTLAFLRH